MAKWLVILTSGHEVAGLSPAEGEILYEHLASLDPPQVLINMTEILFKKMLNRHIIIHHTHLLHNMAITKT